MQRYHFEPVHLKAARKAINDLFPLQQERRPRGLEALFQALATVSLDSIGEWAQRLSPTEFKLLFDHFHHAPSTRILLAMTMILAHARDQRTAGMVRFFIHQLPQPEEIRYLKQWWHQLDSEQKAGLMREAPWMVEYLNTGPALDVPAFVYRGLQQGTSDFASLHRETRPKDGSPLIHALTGMMFDKGEPFVLLQIPEDQAAQLADTYLHERQKQRVFHYLCAFPESGWDNGFLQRLHEIEGAPDPETNPFYRQFEKGRLWGLRRRLFEQLKAAVKLPVAKHQFWNRWLHHCRDVSCMAGRLRLVIDPFIIREEPRGTYIYDHENPDTPIEVLEYDSEWEPHMERVLQETMGWGEVRNQPNLPPPYSEG